MAQESQSDGQCIVFWCRSESQL